MLKIKLSKIGKRTQPKFRLIVSEQSKDPWGNVKEYLGSYDPKTKKSEFEVEKIKAYLKNGVQVTDTVHNLLVSLGVIEAKKRNVTLITKERKAKMAADAEAVAAKEKAEIEKKEAAIRAEAEAKMKAEEEAKAAEEAAKAAAAVPAPEVTPAAEAPVSESTPVAVSTPEAPVEPAA